MKRTKNNPAFDSKWLQMSKDNACFCEASSTKSLRKLHNISTTEQTYVSLSWVTFIRSKKLLKQTSVRNSHLYRRISFSLPWANGWQYAFWDLFCAWKISHNGHTFHFWVLHHASPYGFLIEASICLCNHRSHKEKVSPQYAFFHELSSNASLEHVYHKICIDRMVYPEPYRYIIVLQERLGNHLCIPYTFLWNNNSYF